MAQSIPPALASWLRRTNQHPLHPRLLLSGSALIAALSPHARPPRDLDFVVRGEFDPAAMSAAVAEIAAIPDPANTLRVTDIADIVDYDDEFPGLRADIRAESGQRFVIDFTTGDPLAVEPRPIAIGGVGPVLAVAPESLFAWKVHALVQFGPYAWRPKDLYDLRVLWNTGRLDRPALAGAIDVAFSSRSSTLDELDAFRFDDAWGTEEYDQELWEDFAAEYQIELSLQTLRAEIRTVLDQLL